jgi:hypothetical protein
MNRAREEEERSMDELSAEGRRVFLEVLAYVAQIEEGEAHEGRRMEALDARFEALPEREQQELLRLLEAVAEAEPLEPAAERPGDAIPPGIAAQLRQRSFQRSQGAEEGR